MLLLPGNESFIFSGDIQFHHCPEKACGDTDVPVSIQLYFIIIGILFVLEILSNIGFPWYLRYSKVALA